MRQGLGRAFRAAASLGALFWLTSWPAWAQGETVLVAPVRATITPVIADHLAEGVAEAERLGAQAFVVQLDTPGGLDTSMREIVQSFLGADVPVVVFVGPAGARAASAGAIITMAAHVAAMAPGTAIGAATPIDLQGGDLEKKVVNDAAAYAESLARTRGRDVGFAVDIVREGRSAPAEEAVKIGAVDLAADDLPTLLRLIDGREVTLSNGSERVLRTSDAVVRAYELRGFRQLLQWLADPNIAFLFLSIGTLAILYELGNPGVGGAGVVGVILLILAFFSLSVLPVSAIGGLLLLLAAILFITEVFTPGIGVFAAGGTASLALGGLFLFRGPLGVDLEILIPVTIVVGGTAALIAHFAWRSRGAPMTTGASQLVGATASLALAEGHTGRAQIAGAWWNVRSEAPLTQGQRVRVTAMEGLDLIVEPEEATDG